MRARATFFGIETPSENRDYAAAYGSTIYCTPFTTKRLKTESTSSDNCRRSNQNINAPETKYSFQFYSFKSCSVRPQIYTNRFRFENIIFVAFIYRQKRIYYTPGSKTLAESNKPPPGVERSKLIFGNVFELNTIAHSLP